jgi:hypothetical protein
LREVYSKIINDAFEAGISEAWGFWDMTPAEISGRLMAHTATLNSQLEGYDTLAWMIGSYVAQGYHQPKKYPKKPDMVKVKQKTKPMDEESIRDTLIAFAEIHNEIEGAKHGGNA